MFCLLLYKSYNKFHFNSPDDVVSLDLHDLEPREALNLLRLHLASLSGLPGRFHYSLYLRVNDSL